MQDICWQGSSAPLCPDFPWVQHSDSFEDNAVPPVLLQAKSVEEALHFNSFSVATISHSQLLRHCAWGTSLHHLVWQATCDIHHWLTRFYPDKPDWHKHTPECSITIVQSCPSVPKEWTCDHFRPWPTTGVSHADQCYHSVWASYYHYLDGN